MANYAHELKRLGLLKESVRGTAETTPTIFHAVHPSTEFEYKLNLLMDESIRGVLSEYPPAPGTKDGDGTIIFALRASNMGEYFQMLIADPTTTEEAAFVVTSASNNKIDFTEDGGAEVTATLTAGSYAAGTTSATAGTLCALIKTQMEAVNGTPTYTVTYSYTTKKFTITKNSGVFVIKWSTGTNTATAAKTLLGFTNADTSSAIAATSDSTTDDPAFLHSFTPASTLLPSSYTFFYDRSLGVLKYNFGQVSKIKMSAEPDGFVMVEVSVMFKTEASGSIGSPSYTTETEEMSFQHVDVKVAGSSNTEVKSWSVEMSNNLLRKRTMSGSQDAVDFLVTKHEVTGEFVIFFTGVTERDKFVAGTTSSFELQIAGATIQGAIEERFELLIDDIRYTAHPYGEEDGLLAAKAEFIGFYSTTNSRLYRARVTNLKSSYA